MVSWKETDNKINADGSTTEISMTRTGESVQVNPRTLPGSNADFTGLGMDKSRHQWFR